MEVKLENGQLVIPFDGAYAMLKSDKGYVLYPANTYSKNGLLTLNIEGIDGEIFNVRDFDDRIEIETTGFVEINLSEEDYNSLCALMKEQNIKDMTLEEFVRQLILDFINKGAVLKEES